MIAQTVGRDGSIWLLDGPSNEPCQMQRSWEHGRPNRPQSGAPRYTDGDQETLTERLALDVSPQIEGARHPSRRGGRPPRWHRLWFEDGRPQRAAAREFPFARSERRPDSNDPVARSSQMRSVLRSGWFVFSVLFVRPTYQSPAKHPDTRRGYRIIPTHDQLTCLRLPVRPQPLSGYPDRDSRI